mgnify:CR=1 FL=1
MFSCPVEKYHRILGIWKTQYRTLLVTNLFVYNIDDLYIKRKINIEDLNGFTLSSDPGCNDFILHVRDGRGDYQYESKHIQLVIEVMQYAFANKSQMGLKIFEVPGKSSDLRNYMTTEDEAKKSLWKNPPAEFLMKHDNDEIVSRSVAFFKSEN